MSQSAAIYDNYKARVEKNNVKPEILRYNEVSAFLKANNVDWNSSVSNTTKFWDNDYQGKVFYLADGRVAEWNTDNSAFRIPLLAIFPSRESYNRYQKAMPRYFYMNY